MNQKKAFRIIKEGFKEGREYANQTTKFGVLLFSLVLGVLASILLWSVDWRILVGVFLWSWRIEINKNVGRIK